MSKWPPWPVVYGNPPFDILGNDIKENKPPSAPEIYRTEATGGLVFHPSEHGYVRVCISDGVTDARFKVDALKGLAAYILDLRRRMKLYATHRT